MSLTDVQLPRLGGFLHVGASRFRGGQTAHKPHYILPALPKQFFHLGFFRAWGNQFRTQFLKSVCVCARNLWIHKEPVSF